MILSPTLQVVTLLFVINRHNTKRNISKQDKQQDKQHSNTVVSDMSSAFVLHLFDDRVAIEQSSTGAALVIGRSVPDSPLEAYVDERGKVLKETTGGQLIPVDAIFGIYHLLSGPYIALVTESEVAISYAGIEYRKVKTSKPGSMCVCRLWRKRETCTFPSIRN